MNRIRITAGGFTFIAEPHADAPKNVAAFTALLPYSQKLIHVKWSGEGCWIPMGDFKLGVDYENHTSHPAPGQLLLYPGGISETEILFPYGSTVFASKVGQLAGNHFATIYAGGEQLPELGRLILWKGAQDITFQLQASPPAGG